MKAKNKLLLGFGLLGLCGLLVSLLGCKRPRICPLCKREVDRHWKFCPYDGTEVR